MGDREVEIDTNKTAWQKRGGRGGFSDWDLLPLTKPNKSQLAKRKGILWLIERRKE